ATSEPGMTGRTGPSPAAEQRQRGRFQKTSWPSTSNRSGWAVLDLEDSPSWNRHHGDGGAPKFVAEGGLLAARDLPASKRPRNPGPTAFAPTAIENHLGIRVVRESLQQIIEECPMLQRHDK